MNTHLGQMGTIYDREIEQHKITISQVEKNLNKQISQFEAWRSDIQKLSQRAVGSGKMDEGVLAELRKLGPEAAPLIKELANASDDKLAGFVEIWKRKGTAAKAAALDELGTMPGEVTTKVDDVAAALGSTACVETSGGKLGTAAASSVITALNDAKPGVRSAAWDIGAAIDDGMKSGMNGRLSSLLSTARRIARDVLSAIKKEYGISSPSRVFRQEVGENLARGVGEGWTSGLKKISADMLTALSVETRKLRAQAAVSFSGQSPAQSQTNNYNMSYTINSPKALGLRDIRQEMLLAEQRQVLLRG